MRRILCSVGISLLQPAGGEKPWTWRPGQDFPSDDEVLSFLSRTEPRRTCAELGTLFELDALSPNGGAEVILLTSDTEESVWCGRNIASFLKSRSVPTRCRRIPGLTYEDVSSFSQGLRELVRVSLHEIGLARAEGIHVQIAATGGFKAETAYLTLVGILSQVSVFYLHERFHELVELPPLPIEWNRASLESARDAMERLTGPVPPAEAASLLGSFPALQFLVRWVPGKGERYLTLNGLGQAMLDLLKASRFALPIRKAPRRPRWKAVPPTPLTEKFPIRPEGLHGLLEWLSSCTFVRGAMYLGPAKARSRRVLPGEKVEELVVLYGDHHEGVKVLIFLDEGVTAPEREVVMERIRAALRELHRAGPDALAPDKP